MGIPPSSPYRDPLNVATGHIRLVESWYKVGRRAALVWHSKNYKRLRVSQRLDKCIVTPMPIEVVFQLLKQQVFLLAVRQHQFFMKYPVECQGGKRISTKYKYSIQVWKCLVATAFEQGSVSINLDFLLWFFFKAPGSSAPQWLSCFHNSVHKYYQQRAQNTKRQIQHRTLDWKRNLNLCSKW